MISLIIKVTYTEVQYLEGYDRNEYLRLRTTRVAEDARSSKYVKLRKKKKTFRSPLEYDIWFEEMKNKQNFGVQDLVYLEYL